MDNYIKLVIQPAPLTDHWWTTSYISHTKTATDLLKQEHSDWLDLHDFQEKGDYSFSLSVQWKTILQGCIGATKRTLKTFGDKFLFSVALEDNGLVTASMFIKHCSKSKTRVKLHDLRCLTMMNTRLGWEVNCVLAHFWKVFTKKDSIHHTKY